MKPTRKYFISERFFTKEELEAFEKKYGHPITEIEYTSTKEIDFSDESEKDFLLKKGFPKILAWFFLM